MLTWVYNPPIAIGELYTLKRRLCLLFLTDNGNPKATEVQDEKQRDLRFLCIL